MRLLFFIIYVIILGHVVNELYALIKTWVNNIWGNDSIPSSMDYATLQL